MHSIEVRFGQRIRELRKERGWNQQELAFRAGLDRTYVGIIERGEKSVTLRTIRKLSLALEVPFAKIFAPFNTLNEEDPPPDLSSS